MKNLNLFGMIVVASSLLLQLNTLCLQSHGAAGDVDLSFDPGSGVNGAVNAVVVQPDGKVIIGGEFTTVKGLSRFKVARLNADGSGDSSFNPGASLDPLSNDFYAVHSVALLPDGKVLIGGDFFLNGTCNGIARLNSDGGLDTSFSPTAIQAFVFSIGLQADGKVLIGGGVVVGGSNLVGIARLNSNGTFDGSFASGVGGYGSVYSLALQPDGRVVVGGDSFTLRLNANGSLDGSFDPGTGVNSGVRSVALQTDGKVLIGGWFGSVNGTNRNGIARLNANGSLDSSYSPGTGAYSDVRSVALQPDGKVLIGGNVSVVNGTNITGKKIARLNTDGSLDSAFNPSTDATRIVNSIAVRSDSKILIGGNFLTVNGTSRYRMARLNADGGLDGGFDPGTGLDASIASLVAQPDGKVLISRSTIFMDGPRGIGRLNPDGSGDSSFNPGAGLWSINSLALQPDGKVVAAPMMIRFNTNGSPDSGFQTGFGVVTDQGCGPQYQCYDVAYATAVATQSDGKLLAGVESTYYYGCDYEGCAGQITRYYVARFNANGNRDTSFQATNAFSLGHVRAIAVQSDGKVLVGSDAFTTNFILRLMPEGSLDTSFNPGTGPNGGVAAIASQPDGKVVIAGSFTAVNGTNRNGIARLNANGSLDNSFNPGAGAFRVSSLALQPDGKVLIGGDFTTVSGTNRNHIARLNADGSLDSSFDPGAGVNGSVVSVALQPDGNVLISGDFTTVNGVVRPYVARLYGDAAAPSLSIVRSNALMIISWPSPSTGFVLQQNTNLNTTTWSTPPESVTDNGTTRSISVSPTPGNRFFRLFKP